jgi:putative FmdB family regulatory protein
MPTYEYVCDNCGNKFETFQSIKADPLKHCDVCGKDALRRLISAGGGLIFKGSGFYLTDYKNKPSESSKSSTSKPKEAKTTETKTESKPDTSKPSDSSDKSNSTSSTESKPSSNKKK